MLYCFNSSSIRGGSLMGTLLLLLCGLVFSSAVKAKPVMEVDDNEALGPESEQQFQLKKLPIGRHRDLRSKSKAKKRKAKPNKRDITTDAASDLDVCSPGKFLSDLEDILRRANLPTSKTEDLANYIFSSDDDNGHQSLEWFDYRIHKTNSAAECSDSKSSEIHKFTRSSWCMNIESMLANESDSQYDQTEPLFQRRRRRRRTQNAPISRQMIVAHTCVLPGGPYTEECDSVSLTFLPDPWNHCNMVARCPSKSKGMPNGKEQQEYVTWNWNVGWWSADANPVSYLSNPTNFYYASLNTWGGCLQGQDYTSTYCSRKPNCQVPKNYPSNCNPTVVTMVANHYCLLALSCQDETYSTFRNTIIYKATNTPSELALRDNTACIASSKTNQYATLSCKLACALPRGTWAGYVGLGNCTNLQLTPHPRDGLCSLSVVCNATQAISASITQYAISSNLGTYSPLGPPPYISLNMENACIEGTDYNCSDGTGSGWSLKSCTPTKFRGNDEQFSWPNENCPQISGSYLNLCQSGCGSTNYQCPQVDIYGPDINGGCNLQTGCLADDGVTANSVSYFSNDNTADMPFSLDQSGCMTTGTDALNSDTWWSRTSCKFYKYSFWENIGNWFGATFPLLTHFEEFTKRVHHLLNPIQLVHPLKLETHPMETAQGLKSKSLPAEINKKSSSLYEKLFGSGISSQASVLEITMMVNLEGFFNYNARGILENLLYSYVGGNDISVEGVDEVANESRLPIVYGTTTFEAVELNSHICMPPEGSYWTYCKDGYFSVYSSTAENGYPNGFEEGTIYCNLEMTCRNEQGNRCTSKISWALGSPGSLENENGCLKTPDNLEISGGCDCTNKNY